MKSFTTDTILHIQNTTLIPVVCYQTHSRYHTMIHWFSATKEPFAIIVCDSTGIHALDISSNKVSIPSLIEKVPHLATLLNSYG